MSVLGAVAATSGVVAAPGRYVYGHCLPWGTPTRIEQAGRAPFVEWFVRGSLRLPPGGAGLWLRHAAEGGVRVGRVVRLVDTPSWADVVCLVDDSAAGDAFLEDLSPDGDGLPLSVAFRSLPGGTVRSRGVHGGVLVDELARRRVWLVEVAIVDSAAYPAARLYGRGRLATLAT